MTEPAKTGSPTIRGMYHLFLGNATYTILLAVTAIVVARILGPSDYGLYTVALIVPSFLYTAVRLGLDSAATRYAARLKSDGKEGEGISFVYAAAIFGVVVAAVFSLIFTGLSGLIATSLLDRPQLGPLILPIAMVSVVGQAAFFTTDFGMTGLGQFGRAGLIQALQGAVKLVASIGLILVGFGVAGAVAGYTLSFVLSGVLGIAYIGWPVRRRFPKSMKADVKVGLRYGFPIYLSTLVGGIAPPVIGIVLALTVSNSQIGGYALAANFTALIALVTYPISTALFPLFSTKVEDHKELGEPYRTSVRYTALFVTPVTTFMIAFANPLMVTVYGNAYAYGAPYLALFAVASLFGGVGSLAWHPLLNGIGRTADSLLTSAVGTLASVVAGVLLIRVSGVVGAIAGTIVGVVVSLVVGTWMVQRRLETRIAPTGVWKLYGASGLAAGLSWPLSWLVHIPELALVAGAAAFVVLFIPMLAFLRALDEADIRTLRKFLGFSAMVSKPLDAAIWYYNSVSSALNLE